MANSMFVVCVLTATVLATSVAIPSEYNHLVKRNWFDDFFATPFGKQVSAIATPIKDQATDLVKNVSATVYKQAETLFNPIKDQVTDLVQNVSQSVTKQVTEQVDAIQKKINVVDKALEGMGIASKLAGTLEGVRRNITEVVGQGAADVQKGVAEAIGEAKKVIVKQVNSTTTP